MLEQSALHRARLDTPTSELPTTKAVANISVSHGRGVRFHGAFCCLQRSLTAERTLCVDPVVPTTWCLCIITRLLVMLQLNRLQLLTGHMISKTSTANSPCECNKYGAPCTQYAEPRAEHKKASAVCMASANRWHHLVIISQSNTKGHVLVCAPCRHSQRPWRNK